MVAVDGEGSVFTEYFRTGRHGASKPYLLEGLGDDEIPEFELFDDMLQVKDRDAFLSARELARTEAMFAGGSSGAALWATRQLARTSLRRVAHRDDLFRRRCPLPEHDL